MTGVHPGTARAAPRRVTPGGAHHFFGYYGISPWDATGRYIACLETTFHDRMPLPGEAATIVLVDLEAGTSSAIATTRAWNFQQGAMLHWLPSEPGNKIVFNDADETTACSRVVDVFTGEGWRLPRPVSAVANKHDLAACVNFARLRRNRRVVSIPVVEDYSKAGPHPDDDGVFIMDLHTGELELVTTLDDAWNRNPHTKNIPDELVDGSGMQLWFNHVSFNEDDSRIHFLARHHGLFKTLVTSMWTVGIGGENPFLLVDFFQDDQPLQLSHFAWSGVGALIITVNWPDPARKHHVHVVDGRGMDAWRPIAPATLAWDGHPALNPAKTMMATDCYPVDGWRHVYLVDLAMETVNVVASFKNQHGITGDVRCDPHPRWRRDGRQLCFDGLGDHGRQVYLVDIT